MCFIECKKEEKYEKDYEKKILLCTVPDMIPIKENNS